LFADVNLTYKKPSNVVDGMYATSGTIIRAYQVWAVLGKISSLWT